MGEIVFCHTHKQFHLSHITVADPDSSDSNRLYPNEITVPSVMRQSNSITVKCLISAPKEVFISKIKIYILVNEPSSSQNIY